MLLIAVISFICLMSPARAARVVPLRLPVDFTVSPEDGRRLVSIAPDGSVAALAHSTGSHGRALAIEWDAHDRRKFFRLPQPMNVAPDDPDGVVATRGSAFVTIGHFNDGAVSGTDYHVERWTARGSSAWNHARCASGKDLDEHVDAVDRDGRVADTFDGVRYHVNADEITYPFASANDPNADYYDGPPYAFIVDANDCRPLGRGIILDVRGPWASGYRGYLHGRLAPANVNVFEQRMVAIRWRDDALTELGAGVAYAVNARGTAVGADALPDEYSSAANMHAVGWDAAGRRFAIERRAMRSVAYDIADDGTIVGMLQARDGRHYAFRERSGKVETLDDLRHSTGWRFESAYAIAADGTIVGTGTLHGRATVFRWKP